MLSSCAKQVCVSARDKILRIQDIPRNTLRWMDPAVCSRTLANSAVIVWKSGIKADTAFVQREQVVWGWNRRSTTLDDLCSTCQALSKGIHSMGRMAMWANLPNYFSLGNWREVGRVRSENCGWLGKVLKFFEENCIVSANP